MYAILKGTKLNGNKYRIYRLLMGFWFALSNYRVIIIVPGNSICVVWLLALSSYLYSQQLDGFKKKMHNYRIILEIYKRSIGNHFKDNRIYCIFVFGTINPWFDVWMMIKKNIASISWLMSLNTNVIRQIYTLYFEINIWLKIHVSVSLEQS
jgi:hypothetical protein